MAANSNADDITQHQILQVALKLYQKFGPDKVTMDDVAVATGRSRSSLYYYYKNRDEVFIAVLDTIAIDVADKIRRAVSSASALSDKFYAFGLAKLKASAEWKNIFTAMWLSADTEGKTKHDKTMEVLHRKLIAQESAILKEILSGAMQQGEIRAVSIEEQDTLAFIIYSSIRGIRNEIQGRYSQQDLKASIRMLADMTVNWLK